MKLNTLSQVIKTSLFLIFFLSILIFASPNSPNSPLYNFQIKREQIKMKNGVKLSITYYLPIPKNKKERFPVLFEFLPYRKDDLFAMRDYSLYSYFVRHGYVIAKADIRGTGSSDGAIPDREYSTEEIKDALEIIEQISKKPWSNGNVGMWGISWSGFNAIQVAMQRPPALKAILAADASDDLYKDDVHYIDGAFHIDEYELSIENDLILPSYPDYRIDENYFKNRFERYPWFLTYKKQQIDGPFWRKNSLRWQYEKINVPVYLIGGLLDGYRDSIPRMLENLKVPVKALIGPWNHAWPDNGVPGPTHEWRNEVLKWWDYWLKNENTKLPNEPRFAVFVRQGDPPDVKLKVASGQWRLEEWPICRTCWTSWYIDGNHKLNKKPQQETVHQLTYKPGSGIAAGYWWGENTGDMSEDDAASLIYDSPVLKENIEIVGIPQVHLRVATNARLTNWIVRLEDIYPDGKVALITGGLLNGTQRESRTNPSYLEPEKIYNITIDLHFTTWTFKKGHRIRLAVTNAQFPMIWPTPYKMTTKLYTGGNFSFIKLPVIPYNKQPHLGYLPARPREESPYGKVTCDAWPKQHKITRDLEKSTVSIEWEGEYSFELEGRQYHYFEKTIYKTNELNPADSSFQGKAGHDIKIGKRKISVRTFINVQSNEQNFNIKFKRQIFENEKLLREKSWNEIIPRKFQ